MGETGEACDDATRRNKEKPPLQIETSVLFRVDTQFGTLTRTKTQAMQYQRLQERYQTTGSAQLTWDSGDGARECSARVRNINSGGAQLVTAKALEPGSVAYLTGDQFECLGEVVYCRTSAGSFVVGIRFRYEPYLRNSISPHV